MTLLQHLRRRRSNADVFIECRRCGTTVDRGTVTCPACEAADFARYDLSG